VVANYTGDRLNFAIAIEKAQQAGIEVNNQGACVPLDCCFLPSLNSHRCRNDQVEDVTVGDDCSIPENEASVVGKRGLVGMLFVIKIAGALAERGSPLREVTEIARRVSQNTATYGVGLSACAVPGTTRQSFCEIRLKLTVTRRNHA